jgi:hypothetical protein
VVLILVHFSLLSIILKHYKLSAALDYDRSHIFL